MVAKRNSRSGAPSKFDPTSSRSSLRLRSVNGTDKILWRLGVDRLGRGHALAVVLGDPDLLALLVGPVARLPPPQRLALVLLCDRGAIRPVDLVGVLGRLVVGADEVFVRDAERRDE